MIGLTLEQWYTCYLCSIGVLYITGRQHCLEGIVVVVLWYSGRGRVSGSLAAALERVLVSQAKPDTTFC